MPSLQPSKYQQLQAESGGLRRIQEAEEKKMERRDEGVGAGGGGGGGKGGDVGEVVDGEGEG